MSSKENAMLQKGINYQGSNLVGKLYERKVSPDGLAFYSATLDPVVTFVGVMHTTANKNLQQDTNISVSDVTLQTAFNIESLFGDNNNLVLIVEDQGQQGLEGRVIFGKQLDYNKVVDIYHFHGQIIPDNLEQFLLPFGSSPANLNMNSLPLFITLNCWENIPVYAGYSLLPNQKPPYISVNVIQTGAYQYPTLSNTKVLDNWLWDDVSICFVGVEAQTIQRILYYLYENAINGVEPVINTPFVAVSLKNEENSMLDLSLKLNYYNTKVNYHFSQQNIAYQKIISSTINWRI